MPVPYQAKMRTIAGVRTMVQTGPMRDNLPPHWLDLMDNERANRQPLALDRIDEIVQCFGTLRSIDSYYLRNSCYFSVRGRGARIAITARGLKLCRRIICGVCAIEYALRFSGFSQVQMVSVSIATVRISTKAAVGVLRHRGQLCTCKADLEIHKTGRTHLQWLRLAFGHW